MARALARRVGYVYVDSGAMYRAVTLFALRNGLIEDGKVNRDELVNALDDIHISFAPAGADGVQHTLLNGEEVRGGTRDMKVSSMVSPVAEIPEVRRRLTAIQKEFGLHKGIVMDGRDIGTSVFPDAEMKVFANASAEERARRRFRELEEKGEKADFDQVYQNIRERDHIDTTREVSPLRRADDAVELDNGEMTPAQQMEWLMRLFAERSGV